MSPETPITSSEPLIRVMAEGDDASLVNRVVGDIVTELQRVA